MIKNKKTIIITLALLFMAGLVLENRAEVKGNKTNLHAPMNNKKAKAGLAKGTEAPNFAVKDSANKQVVLSDFKGKKNVLLVFYPGDDTPGCTEQLSAIRDNYKGLEKLNVAVFGVNPASAESHNKFIKKYNFPFPLLVDAEKDIAQKYDSLGMLGFITRTVVLINKEGKIVLYERGMPDLSPEKVKKLL